jgi:hypothetical protein
MIEKPPQDVRDILDELADGQFASIAELNSYLAVQTSSSQPVPPWTPRAPAVFSCKPV